MSKEDYDAIVKLYDKHNNLLTDPNIEIPDEVVTDWKQFNDILKKIKVKSGRARSLGDRFADRGHCDAFTLFITDYLDDKGLIIGGPFSDHDGWLFRNIGRKIDAWEDYGNGEPKKKSRSMLVLKRFIKQGVVKLEEVQKIVNERVLPHLELISYALTQEKKIDIFTHAPCDFWVIRDLAKEAGIIIKEKPTAGELVLALDAINDWFRKLPEKVMEAVCEGHDITPIPRDLNNEELKAYNLIYNCIWGTLDEGPQHAESPGTIDTKAYPNCVGNIVHGHRKVSNHDPKQIPLDTSLGRESQTTYRSFVTSENPELIKRYKEEAKASAEHDAEICFQEIEKFAKEYGEKDKNVTKILWEVVTCGKALIQDIGKSADQGRSKKFVAAVSDAQKLKITKVNKLINALTIILFATILNFVNLFITGKFLFRSRDSQEETGIKTKLKETLDKLPFQKPDITFKT